ncbi:phage-related minor tail protein [Ruminiclostridium hungatei]|uniref:Phage-related minor tail protein n=1 Tax=Ruminiclostridium hungatei TaxID=48256 RepID=A0A1V4SRB5_RUMHU|nr:phage tail tape measure protein [Ruminiclostridium hungatei]OPX46394.1 phage-related minor tail protein [Ruminiclostridium hungatei]
MADDSMVKIMEALGLDYNPAIQATIKFEKNVTDLQAQLIALKSTAGQTAKDINTSFVAELSKLKTQGLGISVKDIAQSKTILDQYGNTLIEVGKKAEDAKNKQAKLNKELADLIHLRKTQQIDAQNFVDNASPFRTDSSTWNSLQKQEQIKLVQELTKAETEHRKVLDEKLKSENAIKATKAEMGQEVKQSTLASMEAQASAVQQKVSAKGLSEEYKLQATLIRNQLTELQRRLSIEGKLSAEEVAQTVQLKEQLSILRSQTRTSSSDGINNPNIFAQGFQRRTEWFMTGSLFFGVTNGAKDAVKAISDVEMGITEIARVMEDSSFQFNKYRDAILQFGVDYGQTFDNDQDIALRWAQAGYNVSDSLENTKISLLALNTAELDAKAATEDLIGIMAQWQLTSKDLPLILDEINKTADDFTVTSQDLVDGLLRSSGAAKIMGLSIEQTISLLTVMREASGRTGREVGNALNSILSYIQRPIAIKTLEGLGIQVFTDAAKTQFRNVMDIFQDIASRWGTLSADIQDGFVKAADDAGLYNEELASAIGTQQEWNDLQQRDISQAAAGVYRRNYFIGMIERLSGAQEVLNNMTDAAGYSMAENERTMDTLEKKYQSLQAAATQLAVAMGDAGMTGILKGLADSGTEALGLLNSMDPNLRNFVVLWGELAIAIKTTQSALKLFGITLPVVTSLTTGIAGLKAGVIGLTASVKGFFVANWPLLAITGVVAATVAITAAVKRANEEQKQFIETTKKNIESLSDQQSGLKGLSFEYETLKSKEQNLTATADEKLRLLEVQKELVSQYGVSITGINAEGEAYSDSIEMIKLRTKALEDELAVEQKRLETAVRAKDNDDVSKLEGSIKKRDAAYKSLQETQQKIADMQKALETKGKINLGSGIVYDASNPEQAKWLKSSIQSYSQVASEIEQTYIEFNSKISDISKDRQQLLKNDAESIFKQLQQSGTKVSDSTRAFAAEFTKSLALQPKDIQSQRDALKGFIEQLNNSNFDEAIQKYNDFKAKGDTAGIDSASKSILDLVHTFAAGKPELDNFVLTMESMFGNSSTISQAKNELPSFKAGIDALSQSFFDNKGELYKFNNELKNLNQIRDSVNKGNSITAEQITELLVQYPELIGAINKTAEGYTVEFDAIETLRQAKIKQQTETLKAELGITETTSRELGTRLKAYGIEISAIKTLSDARVAAANITSPPENLRGIIPDEAFKSSDNLKQTLYDYGEALDLINSLQDKLSNPSYGVTSKSGSKENKALNNALKALEHRKKISEETISSIQAELKELQRIDAAYAKTADEHNDMSERIYDTEKRLKDKRLQISVDWISEQKELGKMSVAQEIAAWEKVLKTQANNQEAIKQATLNLYKLRTQLAEETAQKEENSIEHWAKLGIYSIQQQIDKYRELYKVKAKDQAEEYKRTENLFGLYKNLLDEQQKSIKNAYDERIKQIEDEAKKKKEAQEEIIRGIEAEEKALDRLEGEHDYANEMADLREQLAYWSVRTSEEARKNVADLNKQIAEKEHDHEVELQKQTLEDKKQTAQDAIDAIEKAANEEKEKWESSYKLIEKAFDEHSADIVARAGVMSKEAYRQWVDNYLTPLQTALNSGNLSSFASGSGVLDNSISTLPSHDWGMSDADYQAFKANGEQWAALQSQGYKEFNSTDMKSLHTANDALRAKYGKDPAKGEYPTFDGGGKALSDGFAALHKGEIVFPPNLSATLEQVMTALRANSSGPMTSPGVSNNTDRRVIFNAPLFNSEKTVFEDNADEQSLAGELARVVVKI